MKKLCTILTLVCLAMCMAINAYAAVDADGRPTPWEDPELKAVSYTHLTLPTKLEV